MLQLPEGRFRKHWEPFNKLWFNLQTHYLAFPPQLSFKPGFLLLHLALRMVVYVKTPGSTRLVWNSYVLPFSCGVWVSLAVCLFVLSAALTLLDRAGVHSGKQHTRGLLLVYFRSLFSVVTPFCCQGKWLVRALYGNEATAISRILQCAVSVQT
jgi:hypothetical protein